MKILILAPFNYEDIRRDLILLNFNQKVYSVYYALEGTYARLARKDKKYDNVTEVMLFMAEHMTQKEYEVNDVHFGLVPKTFHFDKVLCYNEDVISTQEALLQSKIPDFSNKFYTTVDITDRCANIMEAIKLAEL